MEYRGMEFTVVRTIHKGWAWSVKRDDRDIAGTSLDRGDAIKKAKRSIENYLRRIEPPAPTAKGRLCAPRR